MGLGWKIVRWTVTGIVALVALGIVTVIVVTHTVWFRDFARQKVNATLAGTLKGQLVVGKIEGTIWGDLILEDVTLIYHGDRIAHLDRLRVSYGILSILSKTIDLTHLDISGLEIDAKQSAQGNWNAIEALASAHPAAPTESVGKSSFRVLVREVSLDHAAFHITRSNGDSYAFEDSGLGGSVYILKEGMRGIIDMVMQRFFSSEFVAGGNPGVSSVRTVILSTNPMGYANCCSALRDFDGTESLGKIRAKTLVISGDRDVATPFKGHGEVLTREIPGACIMHLSAAHISNLEAPRAFTSALLEFLRPAMTNSLEAGFEVRREVLGNEHVDRAIASTNDFNREFQNLITTYAWGTIWTRPGLDHHTRCLLVLAMMASLGRWEEFRMHVRAGLQHGLETCELKEVLLQVAIYAGVPAANTGFHIAEEELKNRKVP